VATARSEELRALAVRVADALPPTVTDVVLTGSVSRGEADERSDIELLVISDEPPADLPLAELETWTPPVSGALWVGGMFEGEFVELVWWTSDHVEERVRAIAAGEAVDHLRLQTADAIRNGVALRGERHADWMTRLRAYPAGLAERIVDDAAARWAEPPPRGVLRPGDGLALAFQVVEDVENVLRIVFALNETWEPGWKRLALRLERLPVKPERLAERIDAAVRALDLEAVRTLADEALALSPPTPQIERVRAHLAERL
jgi:predicted nucleotidyltransferase